MCILLYILGIGMPQILQPLLPMKVSRNSPEPSEQMLSGTGDCLDPNESPDYYQPQPIHLLPEDDSYGDQIPEPQPRQRRFVFLSICVQSIV